MLNSLSKFSRKNSSKVNLRVSVLVLKSDKVLKLSSSKVECASLKTNSPGLDVK